jgi:hypothetical protein
MIEVLLNGLFLIIAVYTEEKAPSCEVCVWQSRWRPRSIVYFYINPDSAEQCPMQDPLASTKLSRNYSCMTCKEVIMCQGADSGP